MAQQVSEQEVNQVIADALIRRRASIVEELSKTKSELDRLTERYDHLRATLADCEATQRFLMPELAAAAEDRATTKAAAEADKIPHGAYREAIIEILRGVYPGKLKALEVGERVRSKFRLQAHPKTAGMTLTRLKNEGIVGLDGRHWYFIPESDLARPARSNLS